MTIHEALETLDLPEGASQEEIVESYEELMARYDPRKASEQLRADYQARQSTITEAFRTLVPNTAKSQDGEVRESDGTDPREASNSYEDLGDSGAKFYAQNPQGSSRQNFEEPSQDDLVGKLRNLGSLEVVRQDAALQRIYREVDRLLPQGPNGPASPVRAHFVGQMAGHVAEAFKQQDRLLLYILLAVPILPLCGAILSQVPVLSLFAPLLGIGTLVCLVLAFKTYGAMMNYVASLPGIFLGMIRPYVSGNLKTAQATEDLARIQELVSYSLLFIEDFGLSGEIAQDSVNRSSGTSNSSTYGQGQSAGSSESYSRLIGTLNPRVMRRLKRSVTYGQEALSNPNLTDYERDKILDEVHADIENATKVDPSEWARDVVAGGVLAYAHQKSSAATTTAFAAGIGGLIASCLGGALVAQMGVLAPILIAGAVIAYFQRETIKEFIRNLKDKNKGGY